MDSHIFLCTACFLASQADWKAHTEYKGYGEKDEVVQWLWEIVESYSPDEQVLRLSCAAVEGVTSAMRGGEGK